MKSLSILAFSRVVPSLDPAWASSLPPAARRKDPRIWQMSLAAAGRALVKTTCRPASIVVGTALGALDQTRSFLDGIFTEGIGSPRSFIASVHNSMAGRLAMELGCGGPNLTVCEGQNSFASTVVAAGLLDTADFPVLLVIVDERTELLDRIHPHLSPTCGTFLRENWDDGAAAFLLTDSPGQQGPTIRAVGPRPVGQLSPDEGAEHLVRSTFGEPISRAAFPACSSSFLEPAFQACGLLERAVRGSTAISSFCPVSRSVAAVELTV